MPGAACKTGVAVGTVDDEFAGRVDQQAEIGVEKVVLSLILLAELW